MAGGWRARESEDLGETSAIGGTHFPALGRLGVQDLGVLRTMGCHSRLLCTVF